ncbi:MAG TPA: recombinase family protein [Streptosporangiaceae bacterium]|nr:recombinase family protein [Streptosporangiaceae bacterium]
MGIQAAEAHGAGPQPDQPVPVAFIGRTSTLLLQDPVASLRRQVRECQAKLPPGWFFAAHYWDVESGGLALEARGHGTAHEQILDQVGIPRDGGLADLLKEADSPAPRFAAVICEDIERSGRDTYYALKLEKQLGNAGIPLFATDEPIDIAGANATMVLVRRVKQGVAEWYRLQLKEKAWRGLREHALAGWNIGPAPYGYAADRVPHPVPVKAAQGATKTRLILDPPRAAVVERIFTWRTVERLGLATIAARLNANPARYPVPAKAPGWNVQTVYAILKNPKYTGYMVYGRTRRIRGKMRPVPQDEWIWSPEPVHPAIISRTTWQAAQSAGTEHASSRDSLEPSAHPLTRRSYLFRGRIRCRDCHRRMCGETPRPDAPIYYACPHRPSNPSHVLASPDHPPRVSLREDRLLPVVSDFCDLYLFGPQRAEWLAAQLPASAAAQHARRQKKTTALAKRLRQIDAAETAHAREIEALADLADPQAPAVVALRSRILARFTELEAERATINEQLAALTGQEQDQHDPSLLGELPLLPAGTLAGVPPRLLAPLFQALDLQILYNRREDQVTCRAVLTDTTAAQITALLATLRDDSDSTSRDTLTTDEAECGVSIQCTGLVETPHRS